MESISELKPIGFTDTSWPDKVHFMQVDWRDRGLQKADDLWVNAGVQELLPKLWFFTGEICLGNCQLQSLHDTNVAGTRCVYKRSLLDTPCFSSCQAADGPNHFSSVRGTSLPYKGANSNGWQLDWRNRP